MAFTGNIADWNLADLLQIVTAERKSGTLTLARDGEEVTFDFEAGRVVNASEGSRPARGRWSRPGPGRKQRTKSGGGASGADNGLLAFLVQTARLRPDQARTIAAFAEQNRETDFRAALQTDLMPRPMLEAAMSEYAQELLYRALTWSLGTYDFVARKTPSVPAAFGLSTEALLLEGMRRIDESPRIDEIVEPRTVFHRVIGEELPGGFGAREEQLLAYVDGTRDVRTLARAAHLTEFQASEALYNLHGAGLIEALHEILGGPATLDLTIDDLEPPRRDGQLLRAVSLALLIGMSLALRFVSRADIQSTARPDTSPRTRQAIELGIRLYEETHGRPPASAMELIDAGLLPDGNQWILAAAAALTPANRGVGSTPPPRGE